MRVWPISIRESFDRTNPWVARVTGLSGARSERKQRWLWGLMLLVVVVIAGSWLYSILASDHDWLATTADLSWGICASLAFIAPSLGAAARRRLDYDKCLPESFATPITDREYVAALHGNILLIAAVAFALAMTVAVPLWYVLNFPDMAMSNPIVVDSLMRLYLRMLEFNQMLGGNEPGFALLSAAAALMIVMNYAAGTYLHASILAGYCQRDRMASITGGIMTALLIVMMMIFMFVRYFAIVDWVEDFLGDEFDSTSQLLAIILIDALVFVGRLVWARTAWKELLQKGMDETRRFVV